MPGPLDMLRNSKAIAPAKPAGASFELSMDDFLKPPAPKPEPVQNPDQPQITDASGASVHIESQARGGVKLTVQRMLREAGMEEEFSFNVPAGRADSYFNNLSQTISRARKRLRKARKKIVEFRLVHVKTHRTKFGYDVVTVKRVRPGNSLRETEMYQQLDSLLVLGE